MQKWGGQLRQTNFFLPFVWVIFPVKPNQMNKQAILKILILLFVFPAGILANPKDSFLLIQADRLFDGEEMHTGWGVLVYQNKIIAVGEASTLSSKTPLKRIDLKGKTLLPGLIEGHSHLLLHAYNETNWNNQVLYESEAERIVRAVTHARATLMAGFTTVRDLGTEGVGYADVGLKNAITKNIIPGPRMIIATKAIVATGSYGPKLENNSHHTIKGAAEADGIEGLTREARTQIGNGADLIKVYADYRWGLDESSQPTFTLEELKTLVSVVNSSGRQVVAHASTEEGMKRAAVAGVSTIEHGDYGSSEVYDIMIRNKVALCATLSAPEASASYNGWNKKTMPSTPRVIQKKKSFKLALEKGVTICFGGDVGVFPHGDNAREMELMVEYGMKPVEVLKSATSVNADVFGYKEQIGRLKTGLLADIIAVDGNPIENISVIRNISFVMKDGSIHLNK
jgi:imidazolonepropionase-like amidohydrolase